MTLEEFKANQRKYLKVEFVVMLCAWVTLVPIIPIVFVADWLDKRYGYHAGAALFLVFLGLLVPVAWMPIFRYQRRRARELGISCPACRKPLARFSAQIVVATGKCGHCGAPVLDSK